MTGADEMSGGIAEEVLLARAYLSRVAEPPAPALARFTATVGAVEAAARVRRGAVPEEVTAETAARRTTEHAAADLEAARRCGARLLVPEARQWPTWPFAAFEVCGAPALAPPLALWVRGPGDLAALSQLSVAVVGARAASGYGLHVAAELGAGMAAHRVTVVSGAALGIDGAAHRGALAGGGPSVAVLACGIDRAYPAAHEALLARIAAEGLVVSEYPPGSVPGRHRFLVRNRIIAALGTATVVVEAGLRSGARRTASDAVALGRPLMAVPGPVTSGVSAGCHRLIREGAQLVTRPEEVLEIVGPMGEHLLPDEPEIAVRPTDGLDPVALLLHDALPAHGARPASWLAAEAGVPLTAARAALVDLERRGLAVLDAGRWRRC
ncbi:DNA processing protein [Pseudonocardia thermophila]|jgi:DNA protecting protein DprA|uniref:DNA processing protein n=1 Tax=Pseudonocardia thermophila TaxID=1848 RepID=A0A1M6ZEE6_PSETH|nr:DNA-processing protein DprA [Pseudonocardia thermophila]SHL28817.1 DNA processing protein [Pseudonocardia thermophila]